VKVLRAIDGFFAWLLHWPLKVLCGLTGKSNFYFARIVCCWGLALFLAASIMEAVYDLKMLWLTVIYAVLFPYAVQVMLAELKDAESSSCDSALHPVYAKFINLRMVDIFLALAITVLQHGHHALLKSPAWIFGYLVIAVSHYFATDFQPPRKSWVKQGLEKAGSWAKSLRPTPVIIPQPQGA
jgi:hypothetical protein